MILVLALFTAAVLSSEPGNDIQRKSPPAAAASSAAAANVSEKASVIGVPSVAGNNSMVNREVADEKTEPKTMTVGAGAGNGAGSCRMVGATLLAATPLLTAAAILHFQ